MAEDDGEDELGTTAPIAVFDVLVPAPLRVS